MRYLQAIAALFLGFNVVNVLALKLERRENPSIVNIAFEKKREASPASLKKRAQPDSVTTTPQGIFRYFVNYTLGTPPQALYAELDTGSGNLIVFGSGLEPCASDVCVGGFYDSSKSSTYTKLNQGEFSSNFGDGNNYSGVLSTDNMTFGNANISSFEFIDMDHWATAGTSFASILGVGFDTIEGHLSTGPYPNLPVALKNAGAINTAAFSLYLDGPGAKTGQALFGGVNKAKYQGPLATFDIPVNSDVGIVDSYLVGLSEMSLSLNGQTSKVDFEPQYALLDSGTSLLALPPSAVQSLLSLTGGAYDPNLKVHTAPCSVAGGDATMDFSFGNLVIKVPLSDVIVPPHVFFQNDESLVANGVDQCIISVFHQAKLILGDTFLRSAYVVFDVDNKQVSLAQANFNSTSDDIVEIVANSTIPGATVLGGEPSSISPFDGTDSTISLSYITATPTTTSHFHTTTPTSSSGGSGKKGDAVSGLSGRLNLFSLGAAALGSIFFV
jgi:aspartyl protease